MSLETLACPCNIVKAWFRVLADGKMFMRWDCLSETRAENGSSILTVRLEAC